MKVVSVILIVVLIFGAVPTCGILLSRSSTTAGECIGIDDSEKPELQYGLSVRNTILVVVLSETIVVPIYILLTNIRCPEGLRAAK